MKFIFVFLLLPSLLFAKVNYKLALNWKAEPQFGGFYALDQSKYQIMQGGSGTPTLQMLLSGQVDFAIVSADEILIANDRGNKDLIALFAVYQKNPQGILLRKTHPAQSIEQLLNSNGILLWQEGLPYAQYIKKKYPQMKIKTAPYPGGITNFLADEKITQQCFVTSEPLLLEKKKIQVKTFLVADTGYNPYTTVLAMKKSVYEKNKKEFSTVIEEVRKAWISYLKNPEPINIEMNKLNPSMDLEAFKQSAAAQKPLIETTNQSINLGSMTQVRWDQLSEQLFDLKIIKNKINTAELFVR